MRYQFVLTTCLIVLPNNVRADRPGLDPTSVRGAWRVVRVDPGSGGAQARLLPDGPITLRIEKSGMAEITSGNQSLVKGHLQVDEKGRFQFRLLGKDKTSLNGTWGGAGRRLIFSFNLHGAPASVLLHPQPAATPVKQGSAHRREKSGR